MKLRLYIITCAILGNTAGQRGICDILRSKNRVDIECYTAALKLYFSRKEKNLNRLAEYATKLGVIDKLTPYLEVLV